MEKAISRISARSRYVCCECNRTIPRRKAPHMAARAKKYCDHCGQEMIATRPIAAAFALGLGWACIVLIGIAAVSRMLPDSKDMSITVGLAICGALACNRVFEATRYLHRPEPSASISRQTFGEDAGAFLALLIGSAFLLR